MIPGVLKRWWVLLLLLAIAVPPYASAQEAPTVVKIELDGLVRIPETSVRSKLRTRVGAALEPAVVSDDIKRLFGMRVFDDIRVAVKPTDEGIIVRYIVTERPTLATIKIVGNDEIDDDDIGKVNDLRRFEILDEVQIRRVVQKIRELYVEEGYYLADIQYKLVERPGNMVDLTFTIDESEKVKVTSITLLGNVEIPDDDILDKLRTREGGWFSFLTGSGQFKKDALDIDVQIIRQWYLHKGYADAKVGKPVVTLSSDRRSIDIVIPVTEGVQYTMKDVDVEEVGAPLDDEGNPKMGYDVDYLRGELSLLAGETFDVLKMQQDTMRLKELYQDLGYANATISNASYKDAEQRTIGFTYKIQKGDKVYIDKVMFSGNDTTRDKVMRRMMELSEGDLYNGTSVKRSRGQIMRLGFFDSVDISTEPGYDNQHVNLSVRVKERQTGTFQVGAGFSSLENFIATAQISKQNFLGHGQTVSLQATLSSIRSLYTLSFYDPFFLDSNFTFSADLFNFQQDFNDFTRRSLGGSLASGYRFTPDFLTQLTYRLESVDVSIGGLNGRNQVPIANLQNGGITSSLKLTLIYDTRNDRQRPSNGFFITGSGETAAGWLGSENEFTRLLMRARWYYNPFWKFILKLNGTIGYVFSVDQPVPIFERFFVGGIFDVRGFQRNSLGPELGIGCRRDPGTNQCPFTKGGNKQLIFNVELEFPIIEQVGIRGVVFFDAGNAFDDAEELSITGLRTAVGFGLRWWSPVGPLRFEWGIPLAPKPSEDPIVFEFTIGNSF
ncbi:MAG: outer membrane protein assembly factor BamA [Myxococcota bacterium]|nr:outer membrane protein assembly factor BamA [Myxococcota bacterium]